MSSEQIIQQVKNQEPLFGQWIGNFYGENSPIPGQSKICLSG